ncbi:NAD(P)/FAD-dependent oxidoreductase [Spirulina sp. CS-785/01]|uniref:NAD(P)/FAD-dependent oxidoreductase n=1 Tax=Spirulina sp. CS-785/01 TaxID=3021716 RepID=UPI00232D54EF|nr:NAD(P)/FAD-dependent oxidoreductase [Spirulina sp. CS-785/01]MDB9315888.1 NAD(P)/FAD-dependent oxidoreductase [Spirulina sp. CS-785/01]
MSESSKRICILGGGFGGLYTALRLSELDWGEEKPEIVLVDQRDRFLFSPLLYEIVSEEMQTWEIAPPFTEVLANTGIHFLQARVEGIDVEQHQVYLENRPPLPYDRLVIAMGGHTPTDLVNGVKEHAIPFRTLENAYRLKEKLRFLEETEAEKVRVAVVGGGYSGVEIACKLADRLGEQGRIRIIDRGSDILKTSPDHNREVAKAALEDRQIWVDTETSVESVGSETISLLYKNQVDILPVDIVLWTVGIAVSPMIQSLPLAKDEKGYLQVNSYLQVENQGDIFALGDVIQCYDAQGQAVPATAQAAIQQADYCAWNIWASMGNRPLLPFRYHALGEMMALGVDNATLTGLGLQLDGPFAYLARRLAYLYRFPTLEHQLTVGLNWFVQPVVQFLSQV